MIYDVGKPLDQLFFFVSFSRRLSSILQTKSFEKVWFWSASLFGVVAHRLVKIFIEPSPVPPLTPFTHLLHLPCLSWSTVFALCEFKYQQSTLKLCCPAGSYHPCHHLRLLPLLLVALIVPLLLSCLALLALCLLLMFVLGWTGHPMSENGGLDWLDRWFHSSRYSCSWGFQCVPDIFPFSFLNCSLISNHFSYLWWAAAIGNSGNSAAVGGINIIS